MDLEKIRTKYLEIERKISNGDDYLSDLTEVLNEQSKEIFGGKVNVDLKDGVYINGKKLKIYTLSDVEYGEFWYDINAVILPSKPKAPTIFEETYHALQYNYTDHENDKGIVEATASYWRAKIFPEDREYKESITPRRLDKELIEKCDEINPIDIILLERGILKIENMLNKYGIDIYADGSY